VKYDGLGAVYLSRLTQIPKWAISSKLARAEICSFFFKSNADVVFPQNAYENIYCDESVSDESLGAYWGGKTTGALCKNHT